MHIKSLSQGLSENSISLINMNIRYSGQFRILHQTPLGRQLWKPNLDSCPNWRIHRLSTCFKLHTQWFIIT